MPDLWCAKKPFYAMLLGRAGRRLCTMAQGFFQPQSYRPGPAAWQKEASSSATTLSQQEAPEPQHKAQRQSCSVPRNPCVPCYWARLRQLRLPMAAAVLLQLRGFLKPWNRNAPRSYSIFSWPPCICTRVCVPAFLSSCLTAAPPCR